MTALAARGPFLGPKRLGLAAATILLIIFALIADVQVMREAWLLAFVTVAGFFTGALGLLMIGHLLGDEWLDPIRREMEAMLSTMPLVVLLFVPICFFLPELYPWADEAGNTKLPGPRAAWLSPAFFLVRSIFYLIIWVLLALWVRRHGGRPVVSGVGLALLTLTGTLSAMDWILSREPEWWPSLFGFAFVASTLLAGLALANILDLFGARRAKSGRLRGLEQLLLALALLTLWMWFCQFLVAWLGNLPDEASWYLRRFEAWGALQNLVLLPSLIAAIVLLIPPQLRPFRIVAASTLLLIYYFAQMLWLVDPHLSSAPLAGIAIFLAVLLIWALWLATAMDWVRAAEKQDLKR